MTTSELLIMSKLCPDRILSSRSGTGAASASGSGLKLGMLLLQVTEGLQFLYSCSTCSTNTHYIQKKPTSRALTEVSQGGLPVACIRVTQPPEPLGMQMLSILFMSGAHCTMLCVSLCRVSGLTSQCTSDVALKHRPLSVLLGYLHPSCLSSLHQITATNVLLRPMLLSATKKTQPEPVFGSCQNPHRSLLAGWPRAG